MKRFLLFLCTPMVLYPQNLVTTTGWVAAIVREISDKPVEFLAPAVFLHPTEYELVPSDIVLLEEADHIFYAGYEAMASFLEKEYKSKLIRVDTSYKKNKLKLSLAHVAQTLGKDQLLPATFEKFENIYSKAREELSEYQGARVLAHFFHVDILKELGFHIVDIFGPGPLGPGDISRLAKQRSEFIIDNIHNPIATPLLKVLPENHYLSFLNFPGLKNTKEIEDVIRYNVEQIASLPRRENRQIR